jgi:hypothetical protein
MTVMGWLWLGSPFVLIALISRDDGLRRLVAANYARCWAAGWSGVLMMCVGAALIPSVGGAVMFTVGTPLVGLAVWLQEDGGDGGGGEEPDVPPPDWDEFERAFWVHVRRRGCLPRPPRAPATH